MEILRDINRAILTTLLHMEKTFPELLGFIGEMPDRYTDKNNPHSMLWSLEEYYHSLTILLKKYANTHAQAPAPGI